MVCPFYKTYIVFLNTNQTGFRAWKICKKIINGCFGPHQSVVKIARCSENSQNQPLCLPDTCDFLASQSNPIRFFPVEWSTYSQYVIIILWLPADALRTPAEGLIFLRLKTCVQKKFCLFRTILNFYMKFLFARNRIISKTEALSERYLLGVNQIHFNFLNSLHFSVALSPNSVSISVTNIFIINGKNVLKPD